MTEASSSEPEREWLGGDFWGATVLSFLDCSTTRRGANASISRVVRAVNSVQLDVDAQQFIAETQTLTAYDSSNAVVGTPDSLTVSGALTHLSVTSATNNIKYFTVESTDTTGFAFSNIVWDCAQAEAPNLKPRTANAAAGCTARPLRPCRESPCIMLDERLPRLRWPVGGGEHPGTRRSRPRRTE